MMYTKKISEIKIDKTDTWNGNNIFITLDTDWCSDDILLDTLTLINEYGLNVTLFITHTSPLIEQIRNLNNIELGIHPNFNFLLKGDYRYGQTYSDIISYYKDLIPEAVSVRSHSMTQSSQILDEFEKVGIKYDVNTFIPYYSGITLKPWKYCKSNLIKIPYFWEDDLECESLDNKFNLVKSKGLKCFDFHPIHLFLNTENINRYNHAKKHMKDINKLSTFVNDKTFGVRDYFRKLCLLIKRGQ